MKILFSLIAVMVLNASLALAQTDSTTNSVTVASILVDKNTTFTSDQYVCLGTGWDKSNIIVYRLMEDIRSIHPTLFHELGDDAHNCIIPAEVPYGAQALFDRLFQHIEEGAKDQLQVAVDHEGSVLMHGTTIGTQTALATPSPAPDFSKPPQYRNEGRSLARKWARAELFIGTGEVAIMGVLLTLPRDFTHWPAGISRAIPNIGVSFTHPPGFDADPFYMNYLLHPYAGGFYYNSLRSQGATRLQSFIFSAVQSTFFEYVVEGTAERPSIQDLIVTPIGGAIVGELSHWATLRMRRNGFTFGEKVLVTLINPTYVLNNGFRR